MAGGFLDLMWTECLRLRTAHFFLEAAMLVTLTQGPTFLLTVAWPALWSRPARLAWRWFLPSVWGEADAVSRS